MGPALRLAPLGRKLPLPGRLGAMTEIAPPWRSTEKPEKSTPARGETRGRVGILTGCVQSVVFGSVNAATARVLAADGYEVVAPPQGCCGALSMHAGRGDEGRAFARRADRGVRGRRDGDREHLRLRLAPEGARARARRRPRLGRARGRVLGARARPRRVPRRRRAAGAPPSAEPHGRDAGLLPPPPCAAAAALVGGLAAPDPRADGGRARRAGHLLRQRRDLQHHAGRRGPAARRPQGGTRARDGRPGLREREPGLPRPGRDGAAARRQPAAGAASDRDRRCLDPQPRRGGPAARQARR